MSRGEAITYHLKKKGILISLALIALLGLLLYANSLNGDFLWDDFHLVKDNDYVKDFSNMRNIFVEHVGAGAKKTYHFYRPIQILSYALDYSIWGLNTTGYRLTNVLLHILVALCIYWLASILFQDRLLSLFAGLLFIAHPVHTEAVSYIAGRADPLASFFMLLCLILYIKDLRLKGNIYYIAAVFCYILALLSRESSLILPVLIIFYHLAFKEKPRIRSLLSLAALACTYIVLRLVVFKFMLPHDTGNVTALQRMPGSFVAITNYVRLLLLPLGLHMEYGKKVFRWSNPGALLGVVILLSSVIIAMKKRRDNNLIFFSLCWFFVALIPFFNIYPINAYMAEHWLYLPSLGFFLLFAKGLGLIYGKERFRELAVVILVCLLSFYSFLTIRQNTYWSDPFAFYKRTLEYVKDSEVVYNNLGILYDRREEYEKAIPLFKKSIELKPTYGDPHFNIAKAYNSIGKRKEALFYYNRALKMYKDPVKAEAYYNIGRIYLEMNKYKEAVDMLEMAIRIYPRYAHAYNNLGLAYHYMGKNDKAIELLKKAMDVNPNDPYAYVNMSAVYFREKEYRLAIQYCDRAVELGMVNKALLETLKPYRAEEAQ